LSVTLAHTQPHLPSPQAISTSGLSVELPVKRKLNAKFLALPSTPNPRSSNLKLRILNSINQHHLPFTLTFTNEKKNITFENYNKLLMETRKHEENLRLLVHFLFYPGHNKLKRFHRKRNIPFYLYGLLRSPRPFVSSGISLQLLKVSKGFLSIPK